jgi:hypothetical protein
MISLDISLPMVKTPAGKRLYLFAGEDDPGEEEG